MRHLPLVAVCLASTAAAQTFVHYKFEAACSSEVINFAAGPSSVGNGILQQNSGAPYAAGFADNALAGGNAATNVYNRVRSSWVPAQAPLTGNITLAFFAKQRTPPGFALNYLAGTNTLGHRLFTNGLAGRGLYQRNIVASGPLGFDLVLPATTADFQTLAAANWVHIALVIDAGAGTANWYVNGAPALQIAGIGAGLIDSPGNYIVGFQGTTNECNYDLDEWILANRAYTAAEIATLAQVPRGADGAYASGIASQCGAGSIILGSTGGTPAQGNLNYAFAITAAQPNLFVLLAGFDRCTFGGSLPLPLDGTPLTPVLAGCWILADALVAAGGQVGPAPATVPLPISASLPIGGAIYAQVLGLDAASLSSSMSLGFAISIGS